MHLFNKENIWPNPCSFLHTSSHPDKYKNNNSVNRELFPKKRREKISKERYFKDLIPAQIQECFQCFYTQSSNLQINSIYRINSTTRNTRLILCMHLPAVVPHVSKHSTRQNQGSKHPTVSQAPTVAAGFQLILPGRNSILHGSQPTRSPSSDCQAQST